MEVFSVLSFDFSAISGLFCVLRITFYDSLLGSTFLLAVVVMTVRSVSTVISKAAAWRGNSEQAGRVRKLGRVIYVYILLFAYPVLSVRVVQAFACHEVKWAGGGHERTGGVNDQHAHFYLRADYSMQCYTREWWRMAIYVSATKSACPLHLIICWFVVPQAGVWVAVYTTAFPIYICYKLLSYSAQIARKERTAEDCALGFLLDDYKTVFPLIMWCVFHRGLVFGQKAKRSFVLGKRLKWQGSCCSVWSGAFGRRNRRWPLRPQR